MAFQGDSIYWVEVEKVVPNPFQPRREFDEHKLRELSESIRMYGVLQPLTVTRKEIQRDDGTFYSEYELIAGERRLRASKLAQVSQVPVIIREGEQSEQEKLELAIIENLQREDLNAVDRALAFKQLADQFGLSHIQVAQKVGRSREYVSNSIRLLALPEHILDTLRKGDIAEGHARTLLMLSDRPEEQEVVFQETLLKKLSVREVERIARKIATDKVRKKYDDFDAELIAMEKQFTETLGTRVQIQKTDFGGKLTIDYFTTGDLEQILARVKAQEHLVMATNTSEIASVLTERTPLQVAQDTPSRLASEIVSEPVSVEPEIEVTINAVPSVSAQDPAEFSGFANSETSTIEAEASPSVELLDDSTPSDWDNEQVSDDSNLYSIRNFNV
jgi:ParB family transcriptional regulator, chromosome partitioning protein